MDFSRCDRMNHVFAPCVDTNVLGQGSDATVAGCARSLSSHAVLAALLEEPSIFDGECSKPGRA
jgi:hypothetical protein